MEQIQRAIAQLEVRKGGAHKKASPCRRGSCCMHVMALTRCNSSLQADITVAERQGAAGMVGRQKGRGLSWCIRVSSHISRRPDCIALPDLACGGLG